MSYVSLLKNIPDFFSQPTGIAAIASLSIHGAIALIVPLMPTSSSKTPEAEPTKAVGLIELSPAEQSRLPQIPGTSPVALQTPQLPLQQTIPPNNYGNTLTILPPSPNIPQVAAPLPQLSPSNGGYAINRLPERRVMRRLNRNDYRARLNLQPNNSNYSSNFGSSSNFDISRKLNNEIQPNNFIPPSEAQGDRRTTNNNNEISDQPLTNPSDTKFDNDIAMGSGQIPLQERGRSAAEFNQNSGTSGNKNPLIKEPLAYNPTDLKNGNTVKQPAEDPNAPAGPQQQQLDSFNKLRQQVSQLYPNSKEKGVIRRTIPTNKSGLEGDVVGRIVVDPSGNILKFLLDGSPSPELKSKAEEYFRANPPQGDKENTSSYSFNLSFKRQASENTGNTSKPEPESRSDEKNSSDTNNNSEPKPESTPGKKDDETASPAASNNPSPTQKVDSNQPVVIPDSQGKLIQKLRQLKQEEQKSPQK